MKLIMVSVRDRASDTFARPFCVPAVGAAIRSFGDEINRAEAGNPLYAHPEDYDLYEVGAFIDDAGEVVPCQPRMIAVGKDLATRSASASIQGLRDAFAVDKQVDAFPEEKGRA